MTFVVGFISASAFTILWVLFFYKRDPKPEKVRDILYGLGAGTLAFLCSFILITPFTFLLNTSIVQVDLFFQQGNIFWITILAFTEEAAKLLIIWFIAFRHQRIDEHMDGIVYGGLVGLGFALVENIFYIFQIDASTSLVRAALIPILHGSTGAILGAVVVEKILKDSSRHFGNVTLVLLLTTTLHALYNASIIYSTLAPIAIIIAVVVLITLLLLETKSINTAREKDTHDDSIASLEVNYRESGTTFAIISTFMGVFTLLLIFPLFFGTIGILFGIIAQRNGSIRWGRKATYFCVAALVLSYVATILQLI